MRTSWNAAKWALVAPVLWVLTACSTLTPQIFSDRLRIERGADGKPVGGKDDRPATLEEIYADVRLVQRRYVSAVEEQSNATPQLSAGLIGLSAAALFKTVTHPNTTDMAAVGTLGAAGYAYGNTLISRPRLGVYRAGADALMCALNAAEPFRKGQATLGRAGDDGSRQTLYGQRAELRRQSAELRALLDRHQGLKQSIAVDVPVVNRSCADARPRCPAVPAGATPEEASLLLGDCRVRQTAWDARCTGTSGGGSRTLTAAPEVTSLFALAQTELAAADRAAQQAGKVIGVLEEAGPLLWDRAVRIQLKVSEEVDKTLPDLASVMAAGQGLRETALGITGADGFKPRTNDVGAAQGKAGATRELSREDRTHIAALEAALSQLRAVRVRLADLNDDSLGAGYAKARKAMGECTVKVNGAVLRVFPAGERLSLAAGDTLSFFVSSGGNVPTAHAEAGSNSAALTVKLEGGQFRFDYTANGVVAGDVVTIHIRDSGSSAEHIAQLTITEAVARVAPERRDSEAAPAGSAGTTGPTGAGRETPLSAVPADLRAAMGLTLESRPEDVRRAATNCQASNVPPLARTGLLDDNTLKAVMAQTCKPKG